MITRTNALWTGVMAVVLCAPACADDWLTKSGYYVGAWKNNNRLQKCKYAEWITFELWKGGDGLPAGVAMFSKGKKRCVGKLSALKPKEKGGRWRLRFDPIESPDCAGVVGGHFVTHRARPSKVVTMVFVPDGETYSGKVIMANTAHFFSLKSTPGELVPLVQLARADLKGLEGRLKEEKVAHDKVIASLRQTLNSGFRAGFPETGLIGTWRGVVVDRRSSHPAELVVWSGTRYPFQHLFGAIRFADDRICIASVQIQGHPKVTSFKLGSHQIRGTQGNRVGVAGRGQVQLSEDGSSLALRFVGLETSDKRLSREHCIPNLSTPESSQSCQTAGVFVRATPTDELKKALAAIKWHHDSPGPSEDYWGMLSYGEDGLASLRALHEEGLERNQEVFARKDRAHLERQRRNREELRARRRAAAAEKLRRSQRFAGNTPGYRGAAGSKPLPPLPKLPKVRGPFDGMRCGDFFNALHNGDLAAISKFDDYYQTRKIRQHRSFLGEHLLSGIYEAAVREVRLADTVLAVYLFNYQSTYGACLGDDAAVFTVVEKVPDIVVENLLGIEVMRYYGWTRRTKFKVKPEFATAFRRVGNMKPSGGMSTVSDFLLNGGGTDLRRDLLSGTRALMKRFDCNSAEIRKLEQTLLKFSSR